MEQYPYSVKMFCKWIDEYKENIKWDVYFANEKRGVKLRFKFHDVPLEFQYGILIRFFAEQRMSVKTFKVFNYELISKEIDKCFEYLNDELIENMIVPTQPTLPSE